MKIKDLGALDDPVMLFGGPYSNLQATQALILGARDSGIAPDQMICTGDVVAYCGQPAETVAEIRALGCPVVAGNCEKQLAAGAMNCGCGFAAGTACDLLSAGWFAHADKAIHAQDRRWMAGLPDVIVFTHHAKRCAVIHGGATDISRFIWETSPTADFVEEVAHIQSITGQVDLVIAGHCGVAFQRHVAGVHWINAGVIGMPPNDGRSETRYVVLQGGQVEPHDLAYDFTAARVAMRAAGLVQGYDRGLSTGYWPSEDVLPPDLRVSALAKG